MRIIQSPRPRFDARSGKNAGFLDWPGVRIRIVFPANRFAPPRAFRSEDYHALTEFGIRHLAAAFLSKSSYGASVTYQFDLLANSHPVDLPLESRAFDLTSTGFASRQNFCPALRRTLLIPVLPGDSSLRHRDREFDVPLSNLVCDEAAGRRYSGRGKGAARGLPPIK